jgi:hypothetical protein
MGMKTEEAVFISGLRRERFDNVSILFVRASKMRHICNISGINTAE